MTLDPVPASVHPRIPLSELKLAIALPSYDGRRHNALPIHGLAKQVPNCTPIDSRGSLLAHVFNQCLVTAFNLRKEGKVTHMLMLHDDILPCEGDWFENFWNAFQSADAQLMSVISPIKDGRGLTSTAVEGPTRWNPRRLTLTECHAQKEMTFTRPDILLNTGCMLMDLRDDWVNKCYFSITDEIVWQDGVPTARVEPEDWGFTRMARAAGCQRIFATRAVKLLHCGTQMFPNYQVYGQAVDQGG